VTVVIDWTDDYQLKDDSREIIWNGQDITSQFTYVKQNNRTARSVGTVTLPATPGTYMLIANIEDSSLNPATANVTYTVPNSAVRVSPESGAFSMAGGGSGSARFRVVNIGSVQTLYTMVTPCPAGFSACTASVPTLSLPAGDSGYVDVSFTAPASGSGWIQLTAASGTVSQFAGTTVTSLPAPDPGYPGDTKSLERIERGGCVTVALGGGAASECGDLVVVHPLATTRALNFPVTPLLVYNSDHARPHPVVAEHLRGPTGTVPDSIRAVLLVNGVQVTAQRWRGWGSAQTRRIALAFDASNPSTYPTGVYRYTLQVTAEWLGGTQQSLKVRTGRMIIVNRSASPFGAGWWLSGVEQLVTLPGDSIKVWVDGAGSARLYRGSSGGPWRADDYDRPDSLYVALSGELGPVTVRTLRGRTAEVWFDAQGRHVRTVNLLQQYTAYRWDGNYLRQVNLPYNSSRGDTARYLFEYNNNPTAPVRNLSRVAAPGVSAVRNIWLQSDASGRVIRIIDPDSTVVGFAYSGNTGWMTTRTDRRGTRQKFTYSHTRFNSSRRQLTFGGVTATTYVQAAITHGMAGTSVSIDSVRAMMDGPRPSTEGCDCLWWHVDRYGAPLDVRDPFSRITTVHREDPRWPGLPTRVVAPNGFATTATYDARGNLTSLTRWNPYGDGRNAVTTYQWDPVWDALRKSVAPEGEVTLVAYDTVRRRIWMQVGSDSARRVRYTYYAASHPRAPGLMHTIALPRGTHAFEYDVRGNLEATISPRNGIRTETLTDAVGRVVRTRLPAESAPGMSAGWQADSTVYDRAGRPTYSVTTGSPMNDVGVQRLHVLREYDPEGNLTAVERWGTPEMQTSSPLGHIRTEWRYDLAGRRVAEIAPDGAVDSVFYDAAGNAREVHTRRADPATGMRLVIRMSYDAGNRLVQRQVPQVTYPARDMGVPLHYRTGLASCAGAMMDRTYPSRPNDGGCGYRIPAQMETFVYDELGNLRQADNVDAQVRRGYFRDGSLASDTLRIRTVVGNDFSKHVYVLGYVYDRNGRRTELRHPTQLAPSPGQSIARYGYDPATGTLASVIDLVGNEFRYEYNASGDLYRRIFTGGITEQFDAAPDGLLSTMTTHAYAPSELERLTTFTRDPAGRVLQVVSGLAGRDTLTVRYSGLGHVASTVSRTYGDPTTIPTRAGIERFSYDALGNMGFQLEVGVVKLSSNSVRTDTTRQTATFAAGTGRLTLGTSYQSGHQTRQGTPIVTPTAQQVLYDGAGNTLFSTQQYLTSGSCSAEHPDDADCTDRASFYGGDGRLRAAEQRVRLGEDNGGYWRATFEEYRYDALGRRIWVRNRQDCFRGMAPVTSGWPLWPCYSTVRRTVWDGGSELWEIQMPGSDTSSYLENDVNPVPVRQYVNWYPSADTLGPPGIIYDASMYSWFDPNPQHGRVGYTHGLAVDQPLSLVRVGLNRYYPAAFPGTVGQAASFSPFSAVLLWDWRGRPYGEVYANGAKQHCQSFSGTPRCLTVAAAGSWSAYGGSPVPGQWHGTLLTDKRDAVGTLYRRARSYDPATGRFTQEDPIGLAGGTNLYGFAGSDPVNYWDPSGNFPIRNLIGPAIGFGAVVAFGTAGPMTFGKSLVGALQATGAAALGSAAAAGIESVTSDRSFGSAFARNFNRSGWGLAGGAAFAGTLGGGLIDAGSNGWLQGYVESRRGIGVEGGLTLGPIAIFTAPRTAPYGGPQSARTLAEHEFGHTLQFIALSGLGFEDPWVPYLAAGVAGTMKDWFAAGRWWENLATERGAAWY